MVFKDRWSLNAGGHKDRFHCITFLPFFVLYTVATLGFVQPTYMTTEGGLPPTEVCIAITNGALIEASLLQLRIRTEEITATSSDFQSFDQNLVIAGASTCLTLQGISADGIIETVEMFRVIIESNDPRLVPSQESEAIIVIMDTDSMFAITECGDPYPF